jgi:hypothetical protein
MKRCSKCETEKDTGEFHLNNGTADGHHAWCKPCVQTYRQERYKQNGGYNEGQKQRNRVRAAGYSNRNRKFLLDYLLKHPCESCGEADPIVLEFDHLDPDKKMFSIGNLLHRSKLSLIENEIKKCRVLCANCHRRRTAEQFDWWKFRQEGFNDLVS